MQNNSEHNTDYKPDYKPALPSAAPAKWVVMSCAAEGRPLYAVEFPAGTVLTVGENDKPKSWAVLLRRKPFVRFYVTEIGAKSKILAFKQFKSNARLGEPKLFEYRPEELTAFLKKMRAK